MKRIAFTVGGDHKLLYETRDHLIQLGYYLVPEGSTDPVPDFRIWGGSPWEFNGDTAIRILYSEEPDTSIPTIVLSSGNVYSDLDDKKVPFKEEDILVIPSVYSSDLHQTMYSVLSENYFLEAGEQALVLRIFDNYGMTSWHKGCTIKNMFRGIKEREGIVIPPPGFQVNTYLHISDYLAAITKLIPKFLRGTTGIYNIGSKEEISYNRLADSVWQLTKPGNNDTVTIPNPQWEVPWYKVPDITRISALLNWKPQVSIRKGLWMYANQRTTTP